MTLRQLTDEEIAFKLKNDFEHQLFSELVKRHQNKIIQQCYQHVRDKEAAKDLSQEVFIRLLTKIHTFNPGYSFINWLRVIIHNRCVDHLKNDKSALHQDISRKIVGSLEEELNTENTDKPTIEVLEELLEKISAEEKLILLLKYKEKCSNKSIQQSMKLSESAVKMRLNRAKGKLQKLLVKYSKNG